MKKLNLKMQGIGEMLSKEQMKNVTGGYGCSSSDGNICYTYFPSGPSATGICAANPSGGCSCRVWKDGTYYYLPPGSACGYPI
ncbi:hypothetical protein EOD41_13255 [Mucilaginibacter limnophilus]|uniref:Uncharacterized protein n=1 Tax=Mucilaginibacter limnophilus TaxID=1932778 RepID=A0A3S2V152_9SPHI|nr:hypothetical protein [Mucilaginibacter limnophilus]RVU00439.1 hypothetical protein EOD41_13255 [Mucilaginibacter limnophilus]